MLGYIIRTYLEAQQKLAFKYRNTTFAMLFSSDYLLLDLSQTHIECIITKALHLGLAYQARILQGPVGWYYY